MVATLLRRRLPSLFLMAFALSAGVARAQGSMTNGENHTGSISVSGEIDTWTFSASQGDSVSLSVGVLGTPTLRPSMVLRDPNGVDVASNAGVTIAQINVTAATNGTYTVLLASGAGVPTGTGSYTITLAKTPGAFVVPPGDEGGPMTNGANHAGAIFLGDLDMWTFTANQGDAISLSIGVVDTNATLRPFIRLRNPNGVEVASDANVLLAQINITAAQTGTYTVLVASGAAVPQGIGSYILTLAQTPASFIVPPGDEGGPMTNGANHAGQITLGDLDQWTFTANQGDSISLSIGVVDPNATLRPFIRLRNPNGVEVGSAASTLLAQINVTAATAGTYTVVVASGFGVPQGTGAYQITLAQTPASFIVPPGDEGGPMVNGANHPGVIHLGDLDQWTFSATQGDSIALSIGVVGSPTLRPFIRLRDPLGVEVASNANVLIAQINVVAART